MLVAALLSYLVILCILCIATVIRGWAGYSLILVFLTTCFILVPLKAPWIAFTLWILLNTAGQAAMIWYGKRGRIAFEQFFEHKFTNWISENVKRFQEWNQ